jgi:hypothetical protein
MEKLSKQQRADAEIVVAQEGRQKDKGGRMKDEG